MALLYSNNASSTLAADLAIGGTTLSLFAGTGSLFPNPTGGDYFKLTLEDSVGNIEIVHCTARSTDSCTITRAQEGTSARAFSAGAAVENRFTAGSIATFNTYAMASNAQANEGTATNLIMNPATTKYFWDQRVSTFGASLIDDANVGAAQTTLGISTYVKTLLDDANAGAARTTLGLGTAAVANTGTASGNVPVLDAGGKLDAGVLPAGSGGDTAARDLAVFNSLLNQIDLGRASGAVPSGYMHLFLTDELATKTGATYDAAGDYYTNAGAQEQVAQGAGTIITNFANNTGAAWDGNSSQAIASSSYTGAAGSRYTGKDWGSGNSKIISGFTARGSTDQGFCDSGAGTITHTLYGSNTAPASPTAGTALGSVTAANSSSSPTVSKLDISSTTAYRYHWLTQTGAQTTNCCYCEVTFLETATATDMTLIPTAITAGAEPTLIDFYMLHKAVDATTLNTDLKARLTRDNGSNWSGFVTLAEVCQFDTNYKVLHGQADLSALASGTSVKWEITTLNTKAQRVRAIAMVLNS